MSKPISAMQVAKAICENLGWKATQLHVQKLLYIIYMLYLGVKEEEIFETTFQSWPLGPVCEEVYFKVGRRGSNPIPETVFSGVDSVDEDSEEAKIIAGICDTFSSHTPGQLVAATHKEGGAWAKTAPGKAISKDDILEEFKKLYRA